MTSWVLSPLLVATLVAAVSARADAQWSFLGDQGRLRGAAIIDVGEVTSRSRYTVGRSEYDPILKTDTYIPGREIEWIEFRGEQTVCIEPRRLSGRLTREAALIVTDSDRHLSLVILRGSLGSVDIDMVPLVPITCP